MKKIDMKKFSQILGYRFKDTELLERALTHRSTELPNNENLEFLGDTILCMVVSEYLYQNYPDASEGEMTIRRSQIINNRNANYSVALKLSLEDYINVGKSFPKNNDSARRKLLANTLEALIGAIYLDSGLNQTRKFILTHFLPLLETSSPAGRRDSKSKLQEYLQSRSLPIPVYSTVEISGEGHDPCFTVNCRIDGLVEAVAGRGSTKKEAEQEAAAETYELLRQRKH